MSVATLMTALQVCVTALAGLPSGRVIYGQQGQPRQIVAGITLRVIDDERVGPPYRSSSTQIAANRVATVQIDGYGSDAVAALYQVAALLEADHAAVRTLTAAGYPVQSVSSVTDLTGVLASTYEPRATMTAVIWHTDTHSAEPGAAATQINVDVLGKEAVDITITDAVVEVLE